MMEIQRDEEFEKAYHEISKPIIARPYPRNEKGEYFYKEIHEAYLMWQIANAQVVPYESCSRKSHEIIINETKNELIDSYDIAKEDEYLLESLVFRGVCIGVAATKGHEIGQKFFSHDFNGDGFQYHDTLQEAKKAAEADLDIYRDRVADGNHVADMGEFNELAYGIVVGQAEWSVDCVVCKDDHENGEYTQYEIGTEILSLYLSEAQEQSHD